MKGVKFKVPGSVKHEETKRFMRDVVKKLNQEEAIDSTDIPNLHRMATSYDLYLTACEWLSENGPITENKKGEQVKHPYVNISPGIVESVSGTRQAVRTDDQKQGADQGACPGRKEG